MNQPYEPPLLVDAPLGRNMQVNEHHDQVRAYEEGKEAATRVYDNRADLVKVGGPFASDRGEDTPLCTDVTMGPVNKVGLGPSADKLVGLEEVSVGLLAMQNIRPCHS